MYCGSLFVCRGGGTMGIPQSRFSGRRGVVAGRRREREAKTGFELAEGNCPTSRAEGAREMGHPSKLQTFKATNLLACSAV
jgi:hypothetical protein